MKKFRAFLSCSLSEEDENLRELFKEYIESLGFEVTIYNFQEPIPLSNGIEKQIQVHDCLIALVTRRHKIKDSNKYICPSWLPTEIAWAKAYGKPTAVLIEKDVILEGLPKIERYETFDRNNLLNDFPKIIKYLTNLRELLFEHDIERLIPAPILVRNSIDSILEIRSKMEYVFTVEVTMTALSDNLQVCHHSTRLKEKYPNLSVKSKEFKFEIIEKPEHVEVKYHIDRNDDDMFLWRIIFEPPLAKGETIRYWYKRVSKNNKPYTLEEAEERMKAPGFPFSEPVAFTDWLIMYPTERLRTEVLFPEGYIVKSPRFTVTIGRSGNVSHQEIQRLARDKSFEVRKIGDRIRLILDVQRPLWGYKYWIMWTPPKGQEIGVYYGGPEEEE